MTEDEVETQVSIPRPFQKHYGNNWTLFYCKGEPLITIGPHWPLTICMTLTFVLSSYFFVTFVAAKKSHLLYILSIIVALIQTLSYLITALKNPGIVTASSEYKGVLQCVVCNNPRGIGALYHCEDCDVCVKGYDHHCPWTGKCVARGNIGAFYVFVTMIPIYIMFFMVVCKKYCVKLQHYHDYIAFINNQFMNIPFILLFGFITSLLISQLLHFGLFSTLSTNYLHYNTCKLTKINPIDMTFHEGQLYLLTSQGVHNQQGVLIITIPLSKCMYSYENLLIVVSDKIYLYDNFIEISSIQIPLNYEYRDVAVFNNKLYLTMAQYNLFDIIFRIQNSALLECEFSGECNFNYQMAGVGLNGIQVHNNQLYIADTLNKNIKVYNNKAQLQQLIELPGGPTKMVDNGNVLYVIVIPKLLQLLRMPTHSSLYVIDSNNQAIELFTFDQYANVGLQIHDYLLMGQYQCSHDA